MAVTVRIVDTGSDEFSTGCGRTWKNKKGCCQINFTENINSFVTWERNNLICAGIKICILFLCIHVGGLVFEYILNCQEISHDIL